MQAAFDTLFTSVGDFVRAVPELRDFAPWPDQPAFAALTQQSVPAIPLVEGLTAPTTPQTAPIVAAVQAVASVAHWQLTYSEDEVGLDFINRYGWFELLGPTGHYFSDSLRAYIAFWGEGLTYAMHLHEPEELYVVLAGSAEFHSLSQPSAMVRPEGTRYHASNQPHAMETLAEPVLTLVLWRGSGLQASARLGTE